MGVFIILPMLLCVAGSVPLEESGRKIEYAEPEYLNSLLAEGNYEEFSRLMGIEFPHLSRPRSDDAVGDPSLNKELFHGDILLTPEQQEQARQGLNFTKYRASQWPGRCVPYIIAPNNYTQSEQTTIQNGINEWNAAFSSCIKFILRSIEKDYACFFKGGGCYSNLGKVGGQQPISISSGCFRQGTILHEMMHCIGFTHEHNRPDRDSCIKILPENIPSDWQSQYEKVSATDFGLQGPYDYYSVMHYPVPAPGTSKPAFQILQSNISASNVGQRNGCSDIDKSKIRNLYRCS